MQIIKNVFKFLIFVFPFPISAQSTYFQQDAKDYHFIDRMEIMEQKNTDLNFSSLKPYNRKYVLQETALLDSNGHLANLSKPDQYNLLSLYMNNNEWYYGNPSPFISKNPVLKTFYKNQSNAYEVNVKDFFLAINPVLHVRMGKELDNDENIFLNSRGITLRGRIANKIGFSSTIIDNQERGPIFFQQQVAELRAVPGVGFYKAFKQDVNTQDYFDGRGYFTFNATKYIDFQFGYDKNFIGNGYRSLFLSDWGNSYLFAKINTRIWKLNYQNLFMELMPRYKDIGNNLLRRKYAVMHHLSMNVSKSLNIGLFEGVMFGRSQHFDFQYLNPIIFYRHVEGAIGSPDNAVAGLDFKLNVKKRAQFYGQFLLDEFILSKIKNDPSNWVNKFGIQLGAKYIDAFGIKNLDLQAEINRVRPFTYSHFDTINNYTHYNQPLAHPLGANFQEVIGIVRYQPFPKWNFYARAIYFYKGLDTANANFGGNIFKSYLTRLSDAGFNVGSGNKATCLNATLNVSYEFRQNLFFEAGVQNRNYKLASGYKDNSVSFSAGIRLNVYKREYNF
jgi:hypothetical protein